MPNITGKYFAYCLFSLKTITRERQRPLTTKNLVFGSTFLEYTLTIPYFECVTDVQNCINHCPLSDNGCYSVCKQRNCTAEFPKKYNQTLPTSLSTPSSTGNFPSGTGLPPSIFGSAASSNRMLPYWAASVGGSSLLGLVVFLTAGVMFAGQRSE